MAKQTPFLSVIIPAYNEEKRITQTLCAVYDYLTAQPFCWEILVVLDGPQDNTLQKVTTFAADKPHIRWIDRRENRGKGYTVRQGMLAARGQIRLFTDADNSTDISHFDQMRPLFAAGKDVVICSRDPKDVPGARQVVPQPFVKRLLGNLGNLFIQLVAVPGIWDTQCGFKAFTQEAAEKLFAVSRIDGWAFDTEILALARRYHYPVGIVPAYWVDDAKTNVRLFHYIDSLLETLKIRWYLLTGIYERGSNTVADIDTV